MRFTSAKGTLLCAAAGLVAFSVLTAAPAAARDDAKEHFAFIGEMSKFLKEGKTPGAVAEGLAFAVVLTDGGKAIAGDSFDLAIPGATKPLKLTLSGLVYQGGRLTCQAKVMNGTGAAVEGVRLDITGATETYKAKDDQGKEILKTRAQSVAIASPLFFGDIKDGEDNGELGLSAGPINFAAETTQVEVRGLVSGLLYVKSLVLPDTATGGQVDVDSKGRVYLASTAGNQVARIDNDGRNFALAAKLPDQAKGMAVNPRSGEIAATCANSAKVLLFTAGGDDKGSIGEAQGVDNYPCWMRYDANGSLWGTVTSGPWHFGADGKPVAKILKAGDFDLDTDCHFDVGPDGTLYAISNKTLHRVLPDGKTAKRIAIGPGWMLGELLNPTSCRVDAQGSIYVAEEGRDDGAEAERISVFDKNGNLIRVFGRGGKTVPAGFPDEYNTAEVYQPGDIAFGPDGRVYISCAHKTEAGGHIMVFQPF